MKKLGKLLINPEKVIKNDELVNLKGWSYIGPCEGYQYWCLCTGSCGPIWICNIPPDNCPSIYSSMGGCDVERCDP